MGNGEKMPMNKVPSVVKTTDAFKQQIKDNKIKTALILDKNPVQHLEKILRK